MKRKKRFARQNFAGQNLRGFTLIELLIVIGIIAILATIAIVAINPAKQFAKVSNSMRLYSLTQIVSTIQQNMIDNRGPFVCAAGSIIAAPAEAIMRSDPSTSFPPSDPAAPYYDICDCLVPTYLPVMPVDTQEGGYMDCTDYNTEYTISEVASLLLRAPHAQFVAEFGEITAGLPGEITVVVPSFDFSLSVDATSGVVSQGSSVFTAVTATHTSGTEELVDFSASIEPVEPTIGLSFSPDSSCTPTCSRDLTISTAPATPLETYLITITGISQGGKVRETTYSLQVEGPILQSCEVGTLSCDRSYDFSMGYKFTPSVDGEVTGLCGFFSGTKRLRLYDSTYSDLLLPSEAWIISSDNWVCESITPVNVTASSTYYIVAEIAGSGGCRRSSPGLPKTCNTVVINASVRQSPSGTFDAGHEERTNRMFGMVDIIFSP